MFSFWKMLMAGSFEKFKEDGVFSYLIKVKPSLGLKDLDEDFVYRCIR
jgi:hypothetical protein